MKINMFKTNSIAFKLAVVFMVSVLLQCLLISATLILGGVITQAQNNAYQSFYEKVDSQQDNLEAEMNNVWTNFSSYAAAIGEEYTSLNVNNEHPQTIEKFLESSAPYLVDLLRASKTTGAFVILNDDTQTDGTHSALYIRNADPNKNSSLNSDLNMLAGPWDVSRSMGIYTSDQWDLRLALTDENRNFYQKPYENMSLTDNANLLGYWSPPFPLVPDEEKIITYSRPLTNTNGQPIGVIGIEISLDYLYKHLSSMNLVAEDSFGYIIGIRKNPGEKIEPLITHGAFQSRMLRLDEPLSLTPKNEENHIYILNNHNSQKNIYTCINKLGLYYNNTPFANEEWFLIGLMDENKLLQFSNQISHILTISLISCLCLGILSGVAASKWFTKPIVALAKQVNTNKSDHILPLKKTGLCEIDDLSQAIDTSQKRLLELSATLSRIIELTNIPFGAFEIRRNSNTVFITNKIPELFNLSKEDTEVISNNKYKFMDCLDRICLNKWDNSTTFHLPSTNQTTEKWLRIIQTSTDDGSLGIVMDVTDEVIQTLRIKLERDHDALTGIKNRNAYKQMILSCQENLNLYSSFGIAVMDLNGLKNINDTQGHRAGDSYICNSSNIICTSFIDCPVFRIGGDEFIALLINLDDDMIQTMHQTMKNKIKEYNQTHDIEAGIAFGYSLYDSNCDSNLDDVFSKADNAMYINKQSLKKEQLLSR